MANTILNVSLETFNEIANALEAKGKKINPEENITLTKDIGIKGPIDWRLVQVRRDVLVEAVKAYEPKMSEASDRCLTDSVHFLTFVNDVYNYVLKGDLPTEQKSAATLTSINTTSGGWGKPK